MREIIVIALQCLNNDIINTPIDDQYYGFLLEPVEKPGHIVLNIRFELKLPIDSQQHLFCKSITSFAIEGADKSMLRSETDTLTGLIQTAMANCRMFVMINNPNLTQVHLKYFDNSYFIPEIQTQLTELGI